jgi:hypothetical protein
LNPHSLSRALFSKQARRTVSGYLPFQVDPPGIEPGSPARQAGVVPLDHEPLLALSDKGVLPPKIKGSDPLKSRGLTPLSDRAKWTAGESNPDYRRAMPASSLWTSSPFRVETVGIEPTTRCLQGIVAPQRTCVPMSTRGSPGNRTRPSSIPERNAAETPANLQVIPAGLEPALPGCDPGVVAAGPRDQDSGAFHVQVEGALAFAIRRVCKLCQSGTRKSRLPQ